MLDLTLNILSHPYGLGVVVLSFLASLAFIIFLWGWSGYLLAHGDKEHQAHARSRMVQGIFMLVVALSVWEVLRSLNAVWEGSNTIPSFSGYIILIWIVVGLWLFLRKSLKKNSAH